MDQLQFWFCVWFITYSIPLVLFIVMKLAIMKLIIDGLRALLWNLRNMD